MDEAQKLILDKIDHLQKQVTSLDSKIDNVLADRLPGILVDVATISERTNAQAKFYTIIGGAVAVLMSLGISAAAMLLK